MKKNKKKRSVSSFDMMILLTLLYCTWYVYVPMMSYHFPFTLEKYKTEKKKSKCKKLYM